jgi:hypothetical protein
VHLKKEIEKMATKAGPYSQATGLEDLSKITKPAPTSGAVRSNRPVGDFIGAPEIEDSVIRGQKMMGTNKQVGAEVTRKAQARSKRLQGR